MLKLLKELKRLIKQGFASKEEKAAVVSMIKDLEADEQEAVSEEADAVDALPEESPDGDEPEGDEAKSIVKSLNSKIDVAVDSKVKSEVAKVKAEFDVAVKDWMQKQEKGKAKKKNVIFDAAKFQEFKKSLTAGQKADFAFEIKDFDIFAKTVGDMSLEGNFDGEVALSELDPMVSRDPQREPFIEQLVSVGTISTNLDVWIETTDEEGNPLPVAELALIPQKDYDFAERSARVKKIAVYSKHSREMAEDLPNLVSEIRNFLVSDLRRVVDTQILSGTGVDENLEGILTNAITYAAGAFAGTILEANRFDVIETAANQVRVALHEPTAVVVHPTDRAKMRLTKGSDGHYVLPPFIAADGTVVSGLRVVANTGITVGNFLVGDFRKSSVKYRRGLTVEMTNSDQDDFIRDRFTVKATVRLVHRVRENDYGAFVKGVFDTAIAALDLSS